MKLLQNLIFLFLLLFDLPSQAQTSLLHSNLDSVKSYENEVKLAIKRGNAAEIGNALRDLASLQADVGMFSNAIDNAHQAIDSYEKAGKHHKVIQPYFILAKVHSLMNDHAKAEMYIKKSLPIAWQAQDTTAIIHLLDGLSQMLEKQNKFAEAIVNQHQALDLAHKAGEPTYFLLNTLSSIYVDSGDFQKGLEFALKVQTQALELGDSSTLTLGVGNEAYAHARLGNFAAHEAAFKRLEALVKLAPDDLNLQRGLVHMKALVAEMRGNYKEAYQHFVRFHTLDSTASAEERAAQYANMEVAYQTHKKEQENERLNNKIFTQKLLFGFVAIVLSLGLVLLFVQRKRLKISNELLAVSAQLANEKLERTKQELSDFAQSLHEKVGIIEQLKDELATQKNIEEKGNLLSQMSKSIILTATQWGEFRTKFERVYPNFFPKLYQYIPQATESDLRFAALTKLNLSDIEIATVLGISSDSVVKTRYRLRKKVENNDVIELIRQF